MTNAADDQTAQDALERRVEVLEGQLADAIEQLAAFVRLAASDQRVDAIQARLEAHAGRLAQLERHLS